MGGRLGSRRARILDDAAVAGVVGAVILLALAVTAFASVAREDVPRWGLEAERSWETEVAATLARVAEASRAPGAASVAVPPAPVPRALDVPLLGRVAPLPPTGSLAFRADCGGFDVRHARAAGSVVVDVAVASTGCLAFESGGAYGGGFSFVVEHGALVGRESVIAGPGLVLSILSPTEYQVALAIPDLRGVPRGASVDARGARVDLALAGAAPGAVATATNATWALETARPREWKAWFEDAFETAGFVSSRVPAANETAADYAIACEPTDCSLDASGFGRVVARIEGPRTDVPDLRLSLARATHVVSVG